MKRFMAIVSALVLATSFLVIDAPPASAATPKVKIWAIENNSGAYPLTFSKPTNVSNFENYDYGGDNWCTRGVQILPPGAYSWNDCISSVTLLDVPCNVGVSFYWGANYVGTSPYSKITYYGTGAAVRNIPSIGIHNDEISSMKWVTRTCPLSAEE